VFTLVPSATKKSYVDMSYKMLWKGGSDGYVERTVSTSNWSLLKKEGYIKIVIHDKLGDLILSTVMYLKNAFNKG
jgi:hypothetical protein